MKVEKPRNENYCATVVTLGEVYPLDKCDNVCGTRIFGNPQARPQAADLDDPQRAMLTYYVLVNGQVDVPMLLTISDVGEQVAWNGFLALRDSERAFQVSVKEWERVIKTGRLWTPDPRFNRAVQAGKLAALRSTQRLRTGLGPSGRSIFRAAALVNCLDTIEPVQSRNLLGSPFTIISWLARAIADSKLVPEPMTAESHRSFSIVR